MLNIERKLNKLCISHFSLLSIILKYDNRFLRRFGYIWQGFFIDISLHHELVVRLIAYFSYMND